MEIIRNAKTTVNFSKGVDTSVYLHTWNSNVDLEFTEVDAEGIKQEFEIVVPLSVVRLIAEELTAKIAKHDEKEAAKKA